MDEAVRNAIAPRVWGARDSIHTDGPVEFNEDYAARVIALLVEQAGGSVVLQARDIEAVADRLVLLPYVSDSGNDRADLLIEVRRLAHGADSL